MVEIDRQFLEAPFYGVRQMAWHLRAREHCVNVKRVRRLMRLMGLMPIYQKPRTRMPTPGHKIYPYLVAVMDWWSSKVLAWRLSNAMDVQFCVDAL